MLIDGWETPWGVHIYAFLLRTTERIHFLGLRWTAESDQKQHGLSTNSIFDSLKVVSESRETLGLKDFWVNTEVTEFLQIYEALSISEASVERLFSYLGRCTENKRRNSILPKTLESLGHMYVKKR